MYSLLDTVIFLSAIIVPLSIIMIEIGMWRYATVDGIILSWDFLFIRLPNYWMSITRTHQNFIFSFRWVFWLIVVARTSRLIQIPHKMSSREKLFLLSMNLAIMIDIDGAISFNITNEVSLSFMIAFIGIKTVLVSHQI